MLKKALIILTTVLIGSFFILSHAHSKILISKIKIAGQTVTDEFIELYNYSSSSVSLDNIKIKKQTLSSSSTPTNIFIPTTTYLIQPFGYFLIAHADCQITDGINPDAFYTNHSTSLAASNTLLLYENEELLDSTSWSHPNAVLVRLPNDSTGNWLDTDNFDDFIDIDTNPFNSLSPARPLANTTTIIIEEKTADTNTETTTDTSTLLSYIKINEFMPNPEATDEWIELYNTTSTDINLSGSILCDSRTSTDCNIYTPTSTIPAFGLATFYLSTTRLNNDSDSIILKDIYGNIIDQISYDNNFLSPEKGQSLARKENGFDTDNQNDWSITIHPTPNTDNIISLPNNNSPAPPINGGNSSANTTAIITKTNTTTTKTTPPKTTVSSDKDKIEIIWKIIAPKQTAPNELIQLDASMSADPRGGKISYWWKTNSSTFYGSKISYIFFSSGTHYISIFASSTQNTTGTKQIIIKVAPGFSARTGQIILKEMMPNPNGNDSEEYIKICSQDTTTTNLSGWKIQTTDDKYYLLPDSTTLIPNDCLTFYKAATHLTLNNINETVSLISPNEETIDQIKYENAKTGQILNKINNNWVWFTTSSPNTGLILGEKITSVPTKPQPKNYLFSNTYSISEARNLKKGTGVKISGFVTALPNTFGSQYFYFSSENSGIQIYSSKKLFPQLSVGDNISVTGEISFYSNTPRVKIKTTNDIKKLPTEENLIITTTTLSEIDEDFLGALIKTTGQITEIKSNYFYLDDGETELPIYLKTNAKINKNLFHEGDTVSVIGILEQNKNEIQLWPRNQNDIQIISNQKIETTPVSKNTFTKYLTISIIGGLALISAWFYKTKTAR